MASSKYQFYEKVRVASKQPELAEIHGEIGAVLGIGQDEEGHFDYTVYIYRDEICWDIGEDGLQATGEFDVRETFYDETTVRVRVDEQGRGWPVD